MQTAIAVVGEDAAGIYPPMEGQVCCWNLIAGWCVVFQTCHPRDVIRKTINTQTRRFGLDQEVCLVVRKRCLAVIICIVDQEICFWDRSKK